MGAVGILGGSATSWQGIPLPLDLGVIGMPGCQLYTDVAATFPLVVQSGAASWTIVFAAMPALVSRSFYTQCLVVDPGTNPLGFVVCNAGKATIGAR